MKEITIKTIGWTIFGICFLIMFYGMFIAMSISNMDSEFRTIHTINMDNETSEAIKYLSNIKSSSEYDSYINCEIKLINQSRMYEQQLFQQEIYYKDFK